MAFDREKVAALRRSVAEHAIPPRPLASLRANPRNSRTHSEEQVGQIAAAMLEWGWTMPILADEDGVILAGHGRLAAAGLLGLDEGPVIDAIGWSDDKKRAYVIADNKLTENGGWDEELLRVEMADLMRSEFDLSLTGFGKSELAALLDVPLDIAGDPEEAPEPPAVPVSRRGDIWKLGRHRLICGDATDPRDVEAVLAGVRPHLMVTDPPYGVDYDADWRNHAARDGAVGMGNRAIGAGAVGRVNNDDRSDWGDAWKLFEGDVAYVWHGGLRAGEVEISLAAHGLIVRSQIIWDKTRMVIGRGDYHWQHEPCWYAVRKGATGHWNGDRTQTTVWAITHMISETGHSTQKPLACMQRPIENNSKAGDDIYEPFCGSGTTIIAAELTGRRCLAIEINPAYVDVAVLRWQAMTGKIATLEASGQTFEALRTDRIPAAAE